MPIEETLTELVRQLAFQTEFMERIALALEELVEAQSRRNKGPGVM